MIKKNDVPSPIKIFASTLVAQGPVYAFFIDNKQTSFFYLLSLCLFTLNSLSLSILAAILKKPSAPAFGALDDDAYWNKVFADRRKENLTRIIKILLIVILWMILAFFVLINLSYIHQAD